MTNEEKKELLRSSLEYGTCKKEIIFDCVFSLSILFIFGIIALLTESALFLLAAVPAFVIYIPMAFVEAGRMREILEKGADMELYEGRLTEPKPYFGGAAYFSVIIYSPDWNNFTLETRAIAAMRGGLKPHYTELDGKRVSVACNRESGEVIVIRV